MSEEEFKEYVKETLSNINSKITKKEQGFINLLGNTFNDVCAENDELRQENTQLKERINKANELTKFYKQELDDWKPMCIVDEYDEILKGDSNE